MIKVTKLKKHSGKAGKGKLFYKWNEQMFVKHGNESRFKHANPVIKYISNHRKRAILNLLSPKNTDKMLDAGCGSGIILREIKEGSVIGIDCSATALRQARKNMQGKNTKLMMADVQKLPFKKNSFNKIICSEVIEHLPSPAKVIDEIKRVSKRGAIVIFTIPNQPLLDKIAYMFRKLNVKKGELDLDMEWHIHKFNLKKFRQLIKNKFKIIKIKRSPFLFPLSYIIQCRN
ncbi:class I SAM-dependent methyltransferase [Candidatus Woesearchaeota archaeon]|nr:class I SAM-dependent methyltransferase [Candidatus Woesearchaeota archaeon]